MNSKVNPLMNQINYSDGVYIYMYNNNNLKTGYK